MPRYMKSVLLFTVVLSSIATGVLAAPGESAEESAFAKSSPPRIVGGPDSSGYFPKKKDQEARLTLRVTVEADGKPSKVEIVDGFYNAAYARGATAFAMAGRYIPARRDGKPVVGVFLFRMSFLLDQTPGMRKALTPEFRAAMSEAVKLIDAQEMEAAQMQVEHMVADEVKSVYEYNVMQATLAETFDRTGHPLEALESCRLATMPMFVGLAKYVPGSKPPRNTSENYALQEPVLSEALRDCMLREASLGYAYNALNSYLQLAGLAPLPPEDPVVDVARQMEERLKADQPLIARAKIVRNGEWRHDLYRPVFRIMDVKHGTLRSIQLHCGKEERELKVVEDRNWSLPATWKDCRVVFTGELGTEFYIVESKDSADAASTIRLD
jgi:hypothetical protein